MTDSDEGSDEEISEGSDDRSASGDMSGSRFEEFLDRFGDQKPDRSDREAPPEEEPTDPTISASDPDAEDDGWVWGIPSEVAADTTNTGVESTIESESDPSQASTGDRIWEVESDEQLGDMGETESDGQSSDRDEGTATTPAQSSVEGEKPEETVDTGTKADERTQPTESDRWAELGSSLRADEEGTATERSVEPRTSNERFEGETERGVDESWTGEATDEPAVAPNPPSEESPALGETRSEALDRVTNAESVLVLGPTDHSLSDAICSRFLVGEEGPRDVLFVTFDGAPGDRIDICHRADGWAGGEIGIIEVGPGSRNAPTASEITGEDALGSITVRHVSKPGDLSKLGIVITQLLAEFDSTPRQTVLCFHTLSALHNQVGTKTLFRFLNTLQGRLRSEDAVGHYHMDPELHDEIVIETLRPIFDSIIRYSADGELDIE